MPVDGKFTSWAKNGKVFPQSVRNMSRIGHPFDAGITGLENGSQISNMNFFKSNIEQLAEKKKRLHKHSNNRGS
jgi:hypothetical protein